MILRIFSLLAALPILAGCLSVLPSPEVPSGLYRLADVEPSATLSRSLVVREPEGARVFGGKALAAEGRDGALRLIKGVEWVEPASRILQVGLLDAFDANGKLAIAKGTGAPGDLELAWRMADFTVSGLNARCDLELTLLHGRTREALMQTRIETAAVAASDSASDRAYALAEAASACVRETADVIAKASAAGL